MQVTRPAWPAANDDRHAIGVSRGGGGTVEEALSGRADGWRRGCRVSLGPGIGAGDLASCNSLESFLDLPLRSLKLEGCLLEVAVRAGERQALADQLFTGGRKMRMGLAGRGKCRVPRFVVHACHPRRQTPGIRQHTN